MGRAREAGVVFQARSRFVMDVADTKLERTSLSADVHQEPEMPPLPLSPSCIPCPLQRPLLRLFEARVKGGVHFLGELLGYMSFSRKWDYVRGGSMERDVFSTTLK